MKTEGKQTCKPSSSHGGRYCRAHEKIRKREIVRKVWPCQIISIYNLVIKGTGYEFLKINGIYIYTYVYIVGMYF